MAKAITAIGLAFVLGGAVVQYVVARQWRAAAEQCFRDHDALLEASKREWRENHAKAKR